MENKAGKNVRVYIKEFRIMKLIQKIIKWLPIILLIFLFLIDRKNPIHVSTYIFILVVYTTILVLRVLDAKNMWHNEFGAEEISKNPSVNKMSELSDELKNK